MKTHITKKSFPKMLYVQALAEDECVSFLPSEDAGGTLDCHLVDSDKEPGQLVAVYEIKNFVCVRRGAPTIQNC